MKRPALLALPLAAAVLAGCGSDSGTASDGTTRLEVVTGLYPLQEAIERVGGEHVTVTNLTRPGAEPHDVELTPKDVLAVHDADSVVYLGGFQPALDDAVAEARDAVDVAATPGLDLLTTAEEQDDEHAHEEGEEHTDEGHADEEHTGDDHEGHDHGPTDPHFWLDPQRLATVADAIGEHLAELDPAHAQTYRDNAADYRADLDDLDAEMTAGLADCAETHLVTGHSAFGYLADAYGLVEESVSGLSPETEPGSRQMAEVVAHMREEEITTIYAEPLVPRDVAETVAEETGAEVLVLDPVEGLSDASAADDYVGIMQTNLATLQQGQECTS